MMFHWIGWENALWYANRLARDTGIRRRVSRIETPNGPLWHVGDVLVPVDDPPIWRRP